MTLRVYLEDPFLAELEAEVVKADAQDGRPYAVLSETIFYPEGGGQPADRGHLGSAKVLDVQTRDGEIRHFLDKPVEPGPVRLEIEWRRRWDHMQQHTAQHLLTAVALRDFGWRTTAFHLGAETSDIELDVPDLTRQNLRDLEENVAEEIRAARRVTYGSAEAADFERLGVRSRLLPEGLLGKVRLVNIEGLDLNTCGGTHCRSTAEIGLLSLLGTEPMRGGTRVFFVAGDRVRRRLTAHENRNLRLRTLLDTGDEELPDVVELRLEREKALARTNRRLSAALADSTAESLCLKSSATVDAHWSERDMAFLQSVARAVAEKAPEKRFLLTSETEDGVLFVIATGTESGLQAEGAGPAVAEALGGRGGGRGSIFQGKAKSLAQREQALKILREA